MELRKVLTLRGPNIWGLAPVLEGWLERSVATAALAANWPVALEALDAALGTSALGISALGTSALGT
ncbi:MAG: hypothetical protein ACKPEY_05000, partial [Planctomycetota bacterium]